MNISIVHVIIGSLFLLYGIISLKKMRLYYREGKLIKGIIKDVHFIGGADYPIVEYYDKDTSDKMVTIEFNESGPLSNYEIGSSVEFIYFKDKNRTKFIIKSWYNNFSMIVIDIVVGLFCVAYGFIQWK